MTQTDEVTRTAHVLAFPSDGNIAFGQKESMSMNLIMNAAKVSNSIEFIEKLDKKFDSDIGEDDIQIERYRVA